MRCRLNVFGQGKMAGGSPIAAKKPQSAFNPNSLPVFGNLDLRDCMKVIALKPTNDRIKAQYVLCVSEFLMKFSESRLGFLNKA
jgi:hypothetical protein